MNVGSSVVITSLPSWWYRHVSRSWLRPAAVIYDICDDLRVLSPTKASYDHLLRAEQRMRPEIDLITCSAYSLEVQIAARIPGVPIQVLPNGVSDDFFAAALEHRSAVNVPASGFGFVGTMNPAWFDDVLVRDLALNLTDQVFHLIGPVPGAVLATLENIPNIRFYGVQSPEETGRILSTCRAGIIPFRKNELTEVVNPLKLYEYSALGLPVVGSATAEMLCYRDHCTLADTLEEWINALRSIPEKTDDAVAARVRFASDNTWAQRAREFMDIIAPITRAA
jgi:glycosyltransferase involved in cell wall biosynthesis